jgi:hypothetical protein
MSTFILRSGGINMARTLNRKLKFMAGLFNGNLVGIEPHVKPQTLSAAVMIWNRVVPTADRVTVKGISAKIIGNKQIH